MSKDIFDFKNTDDLPVELKKLTHLHRDKNDEDRIFELFDVKETLTRNELLIGFYRKYNKVLTQSALYYRLSSLVLKGKIRKLNKNKNNQHELSVYEKLISLCHEKNSGNEG